MKKKKVIRVKLLKNFNVLDAGSIIELYDSGFRNPEVSKNYYPVFGPYKIMYEIINLSLLASTPFHRQDIFEVTNVSDIINPPLTHDIMDEASGMKVCTVSHIALMKLLSYRIVNKKQGTGIFKLSNQMFKDDVLKYANISDDEIRYGLGKRRYLSRRN